MPAALLLALAIAAGQAPAPAAPAAPPAAPGRAAPADSVSPVIVTSQTPQKPTQQATRDFVYGVSTPSPGHDQLARFDDPICIKTEGLDPPYDGVLSEDILRVAKDVGARVDGPGCTPNLVILFTDDVNALMKSLYAKRFDMLEGENASEPAIKRFVAERRPIAWWRITQVTSYEGTPPTNAGDRDASPTYQWARASHIQSNIVEHLARLVVVVDIDKIKGLSLGQIGDYIAFAALADANPDRKPGRGTIMGLFDNPAELAASKLRLTAWDTAFLKAFYRSFSDRAANLQEEQMAGEMKRLLSAPQGAGSPHPAG